MQTLVAVAEVTKQLIKKNPDIDLGINPLDYDRFLVISIGTGSDRSEQKYDAKMTAKWGVINWVFNNGETPIIDCFGEASNHMVDYHNCVVFTALQSLHNYLRIDVSFLYRLPT